MDAKELRQKSKTELAGMAAEMRAKLATLRFGKRQGTKVSELRTLRRDMARVNMVLAEMTSKK